MKIIKVTGNNEGLYTKEAYEALKLQMSTGDFHTHKTEVVPFVDWENVITLEDVDPEAATELYLKAYTQDEQRDISEHIWKRPYSYIGEQHWNTIGVVGRSRDSRVLERSNFDSALEHLGGESETVMIIGASHWACGWVESLRVHIKDPDKTREALKIIKFLEDYPVLDDSDYSEKEYEKQQEDFDYYKSDFMEAVLEFCGITEDDADFDSLMQDDDVEAVASALFSDACGYYGTEDAFLSADCIPKVACKYNLKFLAETNACAELVLACMGED